MEIFKDGKIDLATNNKIIRYTNQSTHRFDGNHKSQLQTYINAVHTKAVYNAASSELYYSCNHVKVRGA